MASFDQNLYGKAIGALAQSFTLVTLADKKSQLDVLEISSKSASKSNYMTALANYESVGLNSGSLTYTFMEKGAMTGHKSFVSALAAAPSNTRTAELMLLSEGSENSLMIRFFLPKLEVDKVLSEVKKPVEKF